MLGPLRPNITPWLTAELVDYLATCEIHSLADFCDAEPAYLAMKTRLPIDRIRESRNLIMASVEAHRINGLDIFRNQLGQVWDHHFFEFIFLRFSLG